MRMNAVEIEEAISELAEQPFERAEFPFAFLAAFGNKPTTIKRLRQPKGKTGSTNSSDIEGGVLQRTNIHIAVCDEGTVNETLNILRDSPKTAKGKVKFILATDGIDFAAEDMKTGEPLACDYPDFSNKFGFFLSLAGISTVSQIKNNPIDIKATARLNKLYLELIKDNEDWAGDGRRSELNQFMARLIFCFFAEDTGIFTGSNLFTNTIEKMSDRNAGNTDDIIKTLFQAMDIRPEQRAQQGVKSWADVFPYVNGGLFTDDNEVPRFSKIARSYLLSAGGLDWSKINPDIFGSMIQAVADEDERGELGMHYTSVPNILKVLNPLFLDDLRDCLDKAGDNKRKLLNLRKRLGRIRVYDPACGSGNFLVIAYRHIREIEAEIVRRRGEQGSKAEMSWLKLTNFYGIEIKSFAAEIARLALLIAEFQCNVRHIGQREACLEVLPLNATGQITTGNALRLDWLEVCPPAKQEEQAGMVEQDLAGATGRLNLEAEAKVEAETYICGNPPYLGSQWQSKDQKQDLGDIFEKITSKWKSLDYVAGWFMKAANYGGYTKSEAAFVSTNSICQGRQVEALWSLICETGHEIAFAYTNFKWANLASHNAGVTVVIVGITNHPKKIRKIFSINESNEVAVKEAMNINAYLISSANILIESISKPICNLPEMNFGNMPNDGGHLLLDAGEVESLGLTTEQRQKFIRRIYGSAEFIRGLERYCLWIKDDNLAEALTLPKIVERIEGVRMMRTESPRKSTNELAAVPHRFGEVRQNGDERIIAIPAISSENRDYLPVGVLPKGDIITNKIYALYDAPLWNMALIASRLHWVWIGTVCVRMRTDFSYSHTLGWNTFPVPKLTQKQKNDLTQCAQNILLAREAHFPATIADLYKPDQMPENLRHAHERNDEVLERIYIGRLFKNDTERLEKLFDLYTKMTTKKAA